MPPKLGILAGGGELPGHLIEHCRATGRDFFVIAFEGYTEPDMVAGTPHAWVRLGAAGNALKLLRKNGVGELVMAGRIERPTLASLRPDLRAARMFARLGTMALGDDGLLSAVTRELEEQEGFRIVGPDNLLQDLVAPTGVFGVHAPDDQALRDIERGVEVARALGALDVGQAVVVQEGIVLGVEAAEGTSKLLERCGTLRWEGFSGVLVKIRKPKQERRVDLPAIGVDTVSEAAKAGLRGIAVQAHGALIIDRAAVVRAADEAGLFVTGIEVTA